jgi:hypothetical protein
METSRIDNRVIRSFPSSYTVNVSGAKMPRMKRLVMKVVPLTPMPS